MLAAQLSRRACQRLGLGSAVTTMAPRRDRADDRYADDVHINREMREVERWNDPASEFLTVSPSLTYRLCETEKLIVTEEKEEQGTQTT